MPNEPCKINYLGNTLHARETKQWMHDEYINRYYSLQIVFLHLHSISNRKQQYGCYIFLNHVHFIKMQVGQMHSPYIQLEESFRAVTVTWLTLHYAVDKQNPEYNRKSYRHQIMQHEVFRWLLNDWWLYFFVLIKFFLHGWLPLTVWYEIMYRTHWW